MQLSASSALSQVGGHVTKLSPRLTPARRRDLITTRHGVRNRPVSRNVRESNRTVRLDRPAVFCFSPLVKIPEFPSLDCAAIASTSKPQQSNIAPVRSRTRYSRELRQHLQNSLGNQCAACTSRERLEFDCIVSQGPDHHRLSWRGRLKFYERELSRGNLQLLCKPCHIAKTLRDIADRENAVKFVCCPRCAHTFRAVSPDTTPNGILSVCSGVVADGE